MAHCGSSGRQKTEIGCYLLDVSSYLLSCLDSWLRNDLLWVWTWDTKNCTVCMHSHSLCHKLLPQIILSPIFQPCFLRALTNRLNYLLLLRGCVYLYIQPLFLTYSINDQKYCQSFADQEDFSSPLSVMVTPIWACHAATVHFGLQQHIELTNQEARSGFFPSPLSTRSRGPHIRPEVWAEREASEQRWHVVSVCVTHLCL